MRTKFLREADQGFFQQSQDSSESILVIAARDVLNCYF